MTRKSTPIVSQSSVRLLSKKAFIHSILPSNTIYFRRYPYKVVFNLEFDPDLKWLDQIRNFELDLKVFADDMLTGPIRKHMISQTPSLFLSNYKDLKTTLAVYGSLISHLAGPVSREHLDLLYSPNFMCEAKQKLWYNMYDCKIETWIPLQYQRHGGHRYSQEDDQLLNGLVTYLTENINIHSPRNLYSARYCTTLYCDFDELVNILPFVKMAYPENKLFITKAMVKE
jgi:hypothetical protein